MGWLLTNPQALVALLIVLPIGLFGACRRRVVGRAYGHDLTGWLALSSGALLGFATAAYYWPPASYLNITTAIILALLSSLGPS